MNPKIKTLIQAIDNYNLAESARDHCPPDQVPVYEKLVDSQHLKLCRAMGVSVEDRAA